MNEKSKEVGPISWRNETMDELEDVSIFLGKVA
jgi:hypothetical protein